jgi:hypothetical protein
VNTGNRFRIRLVLCCLIVLQAPRGVARQGSDAFRIGPQRTATLRDGQHDFDFEIGSWKTHLKRLLRPLTGSTEWVEYNGTTVVRKIWNAAPTWWSSRWTGGTVILKA